MNIRRIVETRIKAYLDLATDVTYPVLMGQAETERVVPCIIAYAPTADAIDLGRTNYGNYTVTLELHIFTNFYDGDVDAHNQQAENVEVALSNPSLYDFWGADNGTLYNITLVNVEEAKDDDKWGNLLRYEVMVCLPEQ